MTQLSKDRGIFRQWLRCTAILLWLGSTVAQAKSAVPDAAATRSYAESLLQVFPEDGAGVAVLVARGDEILYRGARGMAQIELGVKLDPAQRFLIGSITKQFASAGLLKLIDSGKLKLEDPLSKFLPDYPNATKITVHQLLDHTSGVFSYTSIADYFAEGVRADRDTAGMIEVFKDLKPDFEPGKGWSYNNSGYVLVGAVIEKASGKSWHAHLDEVLFQPLGLKDTAYGDDQRVHRGLVKGYSMSSPTEFAPAAFLSMTQPHAAGALISSVDDLHRWNRALHGGKLLSESSYQAMITPTGEAAKSGYGLGIVAETLRGEPLLQHGGGINGFVTMLLYLPQSQLSVVVLRNSDGAEPARPDELARKLAAFALGKPYTDAKAIALSAEQLEEVQGVYRIVDDQVRTIRADGETLISQRSGGARHTLIPIGNDVFRFENSMSAFKLERDAQGKVKGMRFWENGEGEGAGEFAERTGDKPTERVAVELERDALERLVGEYSEARLSFTIAWTEDGKAITVQIPGQPAFVLHPLSGSEFFLKEVDATISFAPTSGPVQTAKLHQGTMQIELQKKTAP